MSTEPHDYSNPTPQQIAHADQRAAAARTAIASLVAAAKAEMGTGKAGLDLFVAIGLRAADRTAELAGSGPEGQPPGDAGLGAALGLVSAAVVGIAEMQARVDQAEAEREHAWVAARRLTSALIASAGLLDVPFTNEPSLSPWTRSVSPALKALRAALGMPGTAHPETDAPTAPDGAKEAESKLERQHRPTCLCGTVNVTVGSTGYTETVRGRTHPECPFHGEASADG